ncbi:MAG: circadian clock KaiB family protein [Gammaproteobacteria bacterium]
MSRDATFKFRLYVAGDAQNSTQAIDNLNALCETYLPGRHEIEIVDVFQDPKRGLTDGIRMTPTLLKISPAPFRMVVGTLSQTEPILRALGLPAVAA